MSFRPVGAPAAEKLAGPPVIEEGRYRFLNVPGYPLFAPEMKHWEAILKKSTDNTGHVLRRLSGDFLRYLSDLTTESENLAAVVYGYSDYPFDRQAFTRFLSWTKLGQGIVAASKFLRSAPELTTSSKAYDAHFDADMANTFQMRVHYELPLVEQFGFLPLRSGAAQWYEGNHLYLHTFRPAVPSKLYSRQQPFDTDNFVTFKPPLKRNFWP